MLRASALAVSLSGADLTANLIRLSGERLLDPEVHLSDGAVRLRVRVLVDRLPMAVPVELNLRVLTVQEMTMECGVSWSNLPLLPGVLKEAVLQRAFEALPGRYENGVLRVDLQELMDDLPVTFALRSVAIGADAVQIAIEDIVLFEPDDDEAEATVASLPAPVAEGEQATHYELLRERVRGYATERAPRWVQPLMPWVLAVPDLFVMVGRLARDPRVPTTVKVIAAGSLAYFITPIDLIPDLIPLLGQVDDVAVALFAIEQMAKRVPGALIQEAWPGEGEVLQFAQEGVARFSKAFPARVLASIKARIARMAK